MKSLLFSFFVLLIPFVLGLDCSKEGYSEYLSRYPSKYGSDYEQYKQQVIHDSSYFFRDHLSTYIKNCNRLKFRQTKLDSVSEETIFMDWTDDELESLGEIDVHYSGIVSNYDEIEPTSFNQKYTFEEPDICSENY